MGEHKELRRSISNDNKNMYKFYDKAWQHTDTNKTRARNKKCLCKGKSYETTFEEKTVPL